MQASDNSFVGKSAKALATLSRWFVGSMYFKFGSGYNSSTSRAAHKAVSHTAYHTARSLVLAKGKSKAIPVQGWTGPQGSRKLRLLCFNTTGTWR
jgi:hypothetical protein